MKKYCIVKEIKTENLSDYEEFHKNCHNTEWKTQLNALKNAGAESFTIYIYENLSIMFFEHEDITIFFDKLSKIDENIMWQEKVALWFTENPQFDRGKSVEPLRKIFDLNQQLDGKLLNY